MMRMLTCADLMGKSWPESLLKCSFNNLLESYSLIFLRAIASYKLTTKNTHKKKVLPFNTKQRKTQIKSASGALRIPIKIRFLA